MGRPLIPWQRYVADVAGEIDPETGMLYYGRVIVTVPRQAGKTALTLAHAFQNCMLGPDRRAWYTAQSGQHASSNWREMAEAFTDPEAKTHRLATRRLTNGSEWLRFRATGSTFSPHPPTADSLHGRQTDISFVDEGWWHSQLAGDALLQAIVPTMTTRRMLTGFAPQLWIVSTEGTSESAWWNAAVDSARAGTRRTALFDWGISPDVDPDDLDAVAAAHPGYGFLLDRETLEAARADLPAGEFARAYGNRRTATLDRLIPVTTWQAAQWLDPVPDGPAAIGAAVGLDALDTTVTVTTATDGRLITAIPEGGHRPGTHWAAAYIANLATSFGLPVAVDRAGPSVGLHDELVRLGVDLVPLGMSDVAGAVAALLAGIAHPDGPIWYTRPHPAMDSAAELATRRYVSDGAFLLGRRRSAGSISALEAAVASTYAVQHLPKPRVMQLG